MHRPRVLTIMTVSGIGTSASECRLVWGVKGDGGTMHNHA